MTMVPPSSNAGRLTQRGEILKLSANKIFLFVLEGHAIIQVNTSSLITATFLLHVISGKL